MFGNFIDNLRRHADICQMESCCSKATDASFHSFPSPDEVGSDSNQSAWLIAAAVLPLQLIVDAIPVG
jgi:hypothetical protein